MRNLLAFLAMAVLVFACVGWWLDWYSFQSSRTPDGRRNISIHIDADKVEDDLEKGRDRLEDLLERKHKDKSGSAEPSEPRR